MATMYHQPTLAGNANLARVIVCSSADNIKRSRPPVPHIWHCQARIAGSIDSNKRYLKCLTEHHTDLHLVFAGI